ncbi:MAG: hypothetical protein AAF804_03075 [Bacteroidota bacterium]
MPRLLISVLCIILLSLACRFEPPITPTIDHPSGNLPLLTEGKQLGLITSFNLDNSPSLQDSIDVRWQEALQAGMGIGRVQLDWRDLEADSGQYDPVALIQSLSDLSAQGLDIFVSVMAFDSEGPVMPDYLGDLPLNHPRVITRFQALMDWVLPIVREHRGWCLSIANEADNFFDEVEGLEDELLDFLVAIRDYVHVLEPDLAVTVTMAEGNVDIKPETMRELIAAVDVAAINFYGANLRNLRKPQGPGTLRRELRQLLDFCGEKNLVFQELGMHSNSSRLNSSDAIQREFFQTVFELMDEEPRLRAAYVFQLVDWSPATIDLITEDFLEENPSLESFIEDYRQSLGSIGLIEFETGNQKSAWTELMNWLARW